MSGQRHAGLPPVLPPQARLLVLGSFPGEASLRAGRYYAHSRNAFWPIVGALLGRPLAEADDAARLAALRTHGLALWDVIAGCRRTGSLDAAIREPRRNVFEPVLAALPRLGAVAFNGATAARAEPWFAARGLRTYRLPSTSPAHAGMSVAAKHARWQVLRDDGWIGPA